MRISGSVWVPDWAVTAVEISGEIEPGTPAAVYGKSGIVSANSWARTEGVREGMSRRGAHALCPSAVLLPADPMREAARFEPIMRALDRHIANALVIEPGRVLFTATGAIRAAGGPEPLAEAVIGEINDAAGCEGLVGFGQGTLTALLAASGNECVVPERTISYLDNKPLSALRVAASSQRVLLEITECIELLGRLGISRIGGLRKLGRIALMTRFGQTGHLIWRLISAEDVHVAGQQKAAPEFSASRGFDPPLDNTEQTVFAAKMLADELGEEMASRSLAGGRLAINAHLMSGSELRRSWLLDGGGVKDIVDRVRWQLASWLSGGEEGSSIVRLTLQMDDLLPAGYRPQPLWGGQSANDYRAEKAAVRLQSLLGEEAVQVPYKAGGRLPSERYRVRAWNEARSGIDQGELPWPGALPEPSPCILHAQSHHVDLLDGSGHHLRVLGDGELACPFGCLEHTPTIFSRPGGDIAVITFAGPWIIEQRWWDHPMRRAYLQVVGAGIGALIYIERDEWKEEGLYA